MSCLPIRHKGHYRLHGVISEYREGGCYQSQCITTWYQLWRLAEDAEDTKSGDEHVSITGVRLSQHSDKKEELNH